MTAEQLPRSRFRLLRRVAVAAAALVVLGAIVVHLPAIRSRLLRAIVSELAAHDIRLDAAALHYNLFTLSATLDRPALSRASGTPPFFEADAVSFDLSWSIVRGGLHVKSLEVRRPRIDVVRAADGTTNLPSFEGGPGGGPALPRPLLIDRLVVSDVAVRYTDEPGATFVEARGLALDLTRPAAGQLAGPLSMAGPAVVRRGDHSTTISTLAGRLAFDGVAIIVERLTVEAQEGRAEVIGTYDALSENPRLQLRVEGNLDVARLAEWAGQSAQAAGGLTFAATVDGSNLTADVRGRNLDVGVLAGAAGLQSVRIESVADGAMTMEWTGTDVAGGRAKGSTVLRPLANPGAGLPVSGEFEFALSNRRWTLAANPEVPGAVRINARASGALADALTPSTLEGHVAIDVTNLDAARRHLVRTRIVSSGGVALAGTAHARFALSGTVAAPRAVGTIESSDARVAGAGEPSAVFLRVDATPRRAIVNDLRVAMGPNVIAGHASLGLGANTIQGQLTAELPDLASASFVVPEQWRPAGSARGSATLGGALDAPTIDLVATGADLRVAGQHVRSLRATARLSEGIALVRTLELMQDEGTLKLSGHYVLDTRQYAFTMEGDDLVVSPLTIAARTAGGEGVEPPAPTPVNARFGVRLEGEGSIDDPHATGTLEFASIDWAGYRLGAAHAEATLAGDRLDVRAVVPSVNGRIDATADIRQRRVNAVAALENADLASLARRSGPGGAPAEVDPTGRAPVSVAGSVTLQATADGPIEDLAAMTAGLEAQLSDATVNDVPVRLAGPLRVRHERGEIVAEDVRLFVGTTALVANGRLGTSAGASNALAVSLTGSLADLTALAKGVPGVERLDASGAVDVQLTAAGALTAPSLNGRFTLADASASFGDLPPLDRLNLTAALANDVVDVTNVNGQWQGAALTGVARLPLAVLGDTLPERYRASLAPGQGPATASFKATSLTPAALSPFLDQGTLDRIDGRVDLEATFRAEALEQAAIVGEVTLARAELALADVPVQQLAPTRLRLANRRLDVVDWRWSGPSGRLDVGGYIRMTDSSPELNVGVAGTLDLRMLSAFAPGAAFAGSASVDLRALGTAADPDVTGQIAVVNADVVLRDPRLAISDLDASATVTRDRVLLHRATATANGGTVEASGSLAYSGMTLTGGEIVIAGRGLALEMMDGLRSEADADLTLTAAGELHALTGKVTILRGAYREPLQLTEQIFSGRTARMPLLAPTEPGLLDRVRLNIAVVTAEDLIVDNNYGRLDVGGNIAIIGTARTPALAGRLTFREGGRVFLGGQTYTLRRGSVDFTNPSRIEPLFDLSIETRVQNYDITLDVRGTPDTLDVSLRSPGLSQQEAVSLLLTGERTEETLAYADIARGQLVMLLSGEVLGAAGRAVGLDTVQVGRGLGGAASTFDLLATESDPNARLTLAKSVRQDVDLIVSQSLRDTGDITWIAIYRPVPRVELRVTTDDDQSEAYEFRHEVPFGGGVPASGARTAAVPPRVARVTIDAPGVSEADAHRRLELETGDRFDFYRFQQDRDRLAAWLHDGGFLEARVASRQGDAAAGTIELVHNLTRGPLTTLRVQGFEFSADDLTRMRTAWRESVFDGFLIEDLETIAREALVRDRFVRAEVAVTVNAPTPDEKVAVVAVEAGPRFAERRIAFRGNQRLSAASLDAFVDARGLGVTAWLNTDALASAIESHYHALGHLAASVTPEDPVFDASSATLPVRIDEGAAFRIGTVLLEGPLTRPAGDVGRVFGLEAGMPYDPFAIEPARRRVEGSYLEEGYNEVRTTAAVVASSDSATVNLTLTVVEGPRAVLADVMVAGADVTRRGTIDHALNLNVGEPVNMSAIYNGQKRLYDTGVFRAVDIAVDPIEVSGETPQAQQSVRASVAVQELPRYRFRYGFRVLDESSPAEGTRSVRPGFVADLLNRNLVGRALMAGVAGQVESDRYLGRAILSVPSFFGRSVTSSLFLTRSRQDFAPDAATPYREDATELTVEQRFRPARTMTVTYGYSYERKHTFDTRPDPNSPFPPLDFRANVARLSGTYAWDTRDDPSNASRGWFHSSGVEYGADSLGSDLRFVRYLGQQYYFRTVGGRLVLASAFRVGAGRGFEQDLIPSEKFYAGGATSVRGFAEQAIGSTDFLGFPVGGNGLLVLNQEARIRLHRWVAVVGFLDAGNVFARASELSFGDLEAGTGAGVRIISPFATLRIDLGVPLTSRRNQPGARWYFGIGQTY